MMPRAGADIGAMMAADLPDPGLGKVALDTVAATTRCARETTCAPHSDA